MSRAAPTFRPRGAPPSRRRRPLLAIGAVVLVALALAGGLTAFFLTRDDGPPGPPLGSSTGGTLGGPQPVLKGPVAPYLAQLGDLPRGYVVYPNDTFGLSDLAFAAKGPFKSVADGQNLATRWGYVDGYQASYYPDGFLAGVVQGGYYVFVEGYLFSNLDGAREAYQTFEDYYRNAPGSLQETVQGLGNQSSAWKILQGTVGTTELPAVYHRFLFRRGTLVTVVQTFGAEPFMTVDRARDVAVVVDEKALGNRPAPTPTPSKTQTPAGG